MSKRTSREVRPRPCSIASALDVIGERWSLLVLREIHMGVRRFVDIHRNTGAPRDILTKRLNTLVAHGVLEKRRYWEHPERYEYYPTAAGNELRAVLTLLDQWGTRWLPDAPHTDEPILHSCGQPLKPHVTCSTCGQELGNPDAVGAEDAADAAPSGR